MTTPAFILSAAAVKERCPERLYGRHENPGRRQLSLTKFLLITDEPMPLGISPSVQPHPERADFATDLFCFSPASWTRSITQAEK
jgi:hypothetical protein